MDKINRKNLNKAKKSFYSKDKFFIKLYNMLDDKNILYTQDNNKTTTNRIPFYTPFLEQKKSIDRSAPYSINAPFQLLHAELPILDFFVKLATDPKYCLLIVDLFTSKIYTYPLKSKNLLKKKLSDFFEDISKKRQKNVSIHLQTNQEFQQNKIKKLNTKFNVKMFSSRIRGGKAFAD